MKKFEGKTALVTGSARGIGYTIAKALAENGAAVAISDIDEASTKAAAEQLSAQTGAKCIAVRLDVSKADDCEKAVAETVEKLGRIDILVNNAGITRDNLLVRMSEDEWDSVLDINLKGAFLMCKNAFKYMMKQREGRIINITSVVGQMGNGGQANYCASKSGLIGLTKSMAREFSSRNVLVNAVAPGFVQTKMTDALKEDVKAKMMSMIPLGRFAQTEDIANAVMFLAGPDSSYITGQIIAVNGGLYI